jgi:ribosome-associated heat shock protein Hsp15
MPDSARTDKWLWAVRLCKTRGLGGEMCATGRVKRLGHPLKAASVLHPGDVLEIPFAEGPGVRTIAVKTVIQVRVGAPEAQACYQDLTQPEVYAALKDWLTNKYEASKGRPTKKDHRKIDKIHGFW